jgi:predicted flap endonuclease-1-like 5' DNA nuclease
LKTDFIEGLCVFGIVFSIFLTLTGVFLDLPPGSFVGGIMGCIVNGLFYGIIIWLIYAIAMPSSKPKPEPVIRYEPKPIPEPEVAPKVHVPKAGVPVIDVEGIGEVYTRKLNNVGIFTTTDLLNTGGTRVGRDELSEKTGISEKLILEWVNLSDLMRIRGIGEEYSDLLEEAGVDTVVELARRNPDNLYAKVVEINEAKNLVRRTPTLDAIKDWIEEAKILPRKVEY